MKFYAGFGSRETPPDVLHWIRWAARALAAQGWTLRSGHADGADQAFELGAAGQAQIFLPWPNYNHETPVQGWSMPYPDTNAYRIAEETHPAWYRLGSGGRALHARNCHQVLGPTLTDPVRFGLCWTEDGRRRGGSATTIRLAEKYKIEVLNMYHPGVMDRIEDMVSNWADELTTGVWG